MADNGRKSGGTFDRKENAEDNAGATEDAPTRSTREALGKSRSMPALEWPSNRNNTRISQSESSFIASLKQRSVVPEEHTVRRSGEIKLVRTLSQLVGSEHSFIEEEGAEGEAAGEAPVETQMGDTLSYMDFPSTIGTDTKLDAELRHPVRSAETVGEGKTEDALVVTRLQGEATIAPATMESSVGEPRIAKAVSDLERDKKPVLDSAEEVTVYTSFSDSSAPKQEPELAKLPFPSEGAEEEMVRLAAPGTSRQDVIKSVEEAHRQLPFKTPEETTAGSEVEDTLVERAGLHKQVEELSSKAVTHAETVEPRGDWEGPAGEKPEADTALTKQPPKRRVSTQVSESQASEWRIVERPVPFGSESQQVRTTDDQALRATEDHITVVRPTIAEIPIETEVSVKSAGQELPAAKERQAAQEYEARLLVEPLPTYVVPRQAPEIEGTIAEMETAVTEAKTAEVANREEPMPPTVPEPREASALLKVKAREGAQKEPSYIETSPALESFPQEAPPIPSYKETTPYIESFAPQALLTEAHTAMPVRRRSSILPLTDWIVPGYRRRSSLREAAQAAKKEPSYIETTPALESFPQEAPPIPSYEETTPYIGSLAPEALLTADQELKRKGSEAKVVHHEVGAEKEITELEPRPPSLATLKARRHSSITPPTAALVPGYRRRSSDREAAEAAKKEPSYIETTPALESFPQEAPPIPSYEETTPYIGSLAPEALLTADQELKRKGSEAKVVHHEVGAEKEITELEPRPPSLATLKAKRHSSITPPTAALVPGYRRRSSDREAAEAAKKEPSYIETTPALESFPQEAPAIPSYKETTPYIESFAPEALAKADQESKRKSSEAKVVHHEDGAQEKITKPEPPPPSLTTLKARRHSSITPPTAALVPGYRRRSSDKEAAEAAKKEPTYIETSPALESFPQEAPPIPSYKESTPYIESIAPQALLTEAHTAMPVRRRSSILPLTDWIVPGYRRRSSLREVAEAAKKEPSYIETTPALESFPQEAPPIPSYEETTPYIGSLAPEALLTADQESKRRGSEAKVVHHEDGAQEKITKPEPPPPSLTTLKARRHSSITPPTAALVPGYRRRSSDREAAEATKKEPSYIETTPALESFPQEAPAIPSYKETTPYIESFAPEALAKADQESKRKGSEAKVVHHEDGTQEKITKPEPPPPSLTTLKARRHSSITPPTAALVPGYRRRSSDREAAEAAKKEPSYIETTPALESFPQEAPAIPSYKETTPYIESFAPEALAKADQESKRRGSEAKVVHHEDGAQEKITKPEPPPPSLTTLKARRHSSITPPTAALVPGYRRRSSDREAAEAAKKEPSYIETTPALESFPQEAPAIPSYKETTPYIESFAPEALAKADQELKRKGSEAKVVHHEVGAEKEITELEPRPPSLATMKARRHSSITPPTAALVPGYRRRSSDREAAEAAKKEPTYIETTPILQSYPQEAPPTTSYAETTPYIESFPPASSVVDAKALRPPVPVEERPALDLRKETSVAQEWALMELRPPTGTEITEKEATRLAVVDRGEAEGRVLPAFKMGESEKGSLVDLSKSAEKPFAGGIFSHVSMPTSGKRSRQASDVTGMKHSEGAAMQEGGEITVTVRDYEADHEEQPSSVGTQSSQEEEELEKRVRKEKLALALYDEKVPTVVLDAKKHAGRLAPDGARLKPVPLKPEVKKSQPLAPVPEVELAQLVIRPESAMVRAEQPLSADELLPTAKEVVPVEKAVEEWKPAAVISVKPEPVELSEGVARPVAEETPKIPSEVAEVRALQEEKPKFAPISKPPESDAERPEQGVYVTVLTPKHDEPFRVLAGMPVITEPTKLPPVAAIERTHHISAPWSTRSSVAAAEEAARGRAAWEQELTRAAGTDRRIERLHEKKSAKYSVIIRDGQPVRSTYSSSECTEPVLEDFPDSLAYQYLASEEQVLERIVAVDSTESISVPAHPPSDEQPPGPGTQGDASSAHTAAPGPERFQPKQREEPRSEGPTSESEFKPVEAAPSTNALEEMVAASAEAAVQEQNEGSSFEIGIPIDEQTEFPTMKDDLEKEDQQPEETTTDAGFEEFSAARHEEMVPKARPSTVESTTALESGEQRLALEYLPAQIDKHVSTTPTPSRVPLLAQLVKVKDEATFEPEEDVPTTKTFEKDYMITTASQRSDEEEARPLTAASKKVAVGTMELDKLQSDPELPQIEHTLSRTAVADGKPNLDTELTAPGVLPQLKVKEEIGHEEAAGQPKINEATVPESDGLQYPLTEHVEPTCPPQPEIAVKEEIPVLEALSESDQPQVQVSAQAKPLAEAPLYVHPALTEPQKHAALDETTAIVEVRPRDLKPTKDRPQVDYHAPVQATKGERKELRPTIAKSVEFRIHQPDELALPEVVEKSSQALVPRTAQKQISEAPSIYDADVEAKKQQTAVMLSIEAPGGVRASLSQTEPPVKEVSTVAAEEQVGFSAPKETEVAIGEALTEPTARPAITGPVEESKAEVTSEATPSMQRVPGAPATVTTSTLVPRFETALDVHATQGVDLTPIKSERWPVEAMIARPPVEPGRALAGAAQVKEEVSAEYYAHTTPPPAAVLPTKVPQQEEGAEVCEAPKGVAVTPMIPEAARLLMMKPSQDATAVTESRTMSQTERTQMQQTLQASEVPSIEVRSAGDFSSEGAAVLVGVEDVDEDHEYHEEVREKRSTSIASMLRESPATIMAQLNVASSKPESPAERKGEAVLEPRFHTPPSEEELDKSMIAGAITDLSIVPEEITKSLTDLTESTNIGPLPALPQASAPDLQSFQVKEPEATALKALQEGIAAKLPPEVEAPVYLTTATAEAEKEPAAAVEPALIVERPEVTGLPQEDIAEEQELRGKSASARAEEPPERLPQGITTVPALEPHAGLASQLSQVEPTSLAIAGAKDSLALVELAAPHTEPSAAKPELTEQPQKTFAKEEQLTYFPSTKPTTRAASLDIAEAALQSAVKVVEENVREAAAAAEREAKKVEEEKEAASVTAAPAPPIEVVESVSATPGTVPTPPVGELVAANSGAIDDMRAEAPGVSESELAIAEALRASREEACVQGIAAEAVRPQLEQQEAEVVSLESLGRPLISEREMDEAQISGTVLPPSETKTYAEFQKSLKASSAATVPSTGTVALRRLTSEYQVAVPDAELSKVHADSGESATAIEPALQRPLAEKEEKEVRELAVAAVMVAAASAAVNAQQQREMSALREPSVTGSMISAGSEVPVASAVAREIRQKLAGELEVLPSASRTALVDVLAAAPSQEPGSHNAIVGPPSTISTSWSTEDAGRIRRHSSRDRSEDFRVPEKLVPALDDEIHVPRPTSFSVPVINIQYNFHFPRPDSPGAPGQQSPPSPEQAMAAQVLQGALAQQGMAGHIPGRHVLSPEQHALREMTERLNRVALHGSEPYTGRQSPGKGTMFRPLPRKPVPLVPPLMPPGDEMSAEERKRLCGFRFIVCLLAFLMIVFVLLYCLGLIGNKRYFMYYS
ncbi:titin-like [Dermacentor albipictus]|uniref:titin-like n=1 Tax=Dermacentor albipictus TaxID=60249 RepID=UPI0038FD11B8